MLGRFRLAVGDRAIPNDAWPPRGNRRIQDFTREGGFVTLFGSQGDGRGQFQAPIGVATSAARDNYVVDRAVARVQKFRRR